MKRLNHRQAVDAIRALEPFRNHTGTLRGVTDMDLVTRGEMGSTWFDCMMFDCPEYVVMSFATPIAWAYDSQWSVRPDATTQYGAGRWVTDNFYSVTTAAHQELVHQAWKGTDNA